MCFFKRKMSRKLAKIGSRVDTSYLLYVNNEEPITFACKEDCYSYLARYRKETAISRLQIYRIETYSL